MPMNIATWNATLSLRKPPAVAADRIQTEAHWIAVGPFAGATRSISLGASPPGAQRVVSTLPAVEQVATVKTLLLISLLATSISVAGCSSSSSDDDAEPTADQL